MARSTTAAPSTAEPDTATLVEKSRQPALGKHADRTLNGLVRKLEAALAIARAGDEADQAKDLAAALRRTKAEVKKRGAGDAQTPVTKGASRQRKADAQGGGSAPAKAVAAPRRAAARPEDMPDGSVDAARLSGAETVSGGGTGPDRAERGAVEKPREPKDPARKAATKAENKARKEAEKAERKRVKEAEKAERKAARKAERKAARKAEKAEAKRKDA